jgi:hypothetical protein
MSDENKKEIKVVSGDGKDLDISPVYEHIKSDKVPNDNKKKDIVIPKSSSDKNK